jgi:hypothetical protein
VAESFNVASSNRIAISGSALTIDPTSALAQGTTYFVVINPGAIEDLAGNDFAGTITYDFATALPDNPAEQPVITSSGGGAAATVSAFDGSSAVVRVEATDPNDDTLTYSITGGLDGTFFTINPQTGVLAFVAAPDFESPADSNGDNAYEVIVTAFDGVFADSQTLNVTVEDRSVAPRLIAPDGFAGGIGGTTAVFLTSGFQDIRIIDAPGTITLNGPPGGDDIVRFDSAASAYTITRVGSRVEIADGDTQVSIPVSPTGINVAFADGPRTLGFNDGQIRIGSQVVDNIANAITAPAETDPLPDLADPSVRGRLIVAEGSPVIADGNLDVFGTTFDNELFVISGGDIAIRVGFIGGMDTIGFDGAASDYTASRLGSTVFIETEGTRVSIPISPTGTKLLFGNDERLLKVDTATGKILIGTQEIGASPTPLSGNLQASAIDLADFDFAEFQISGDSIALAPKSFDEMLEMVDLGTDNVLMPRDPEPHFSSGPLATDLLVTMPDYVIPGLTLDSFAP